MWTVEALHSTWSWRQVVSEMRYDSQSLQESEIATEWDRKYLYGDVEPMNFNEIPQFRGGGTINGLPCFT